MVGPGNKTSRSSTASSTGVGHHGAGKGKSKDLLPCADCPERVLKIRCDLFEFGRLTRSPTQGHVNVCLIEGIDIVPEFVASAHARFPQVNFRLGTFESLPVLGNSLSGILAWYTIIHTVPSRLQQVLAEFARCLSPGGSLLLGMVAYSQASWSHLLGLPEPAQE